LGFSVYGLRFFMIFLLISRYTPAYSLGIGRSRVFVLFVVFLYCVVVFLYYVCALFVCNVCYLSVVLLYCCHRVKAQLQFNIYIYIYKFQLSIN
jgi:hypothetical protein